MAQRRFISAWLAVLLQSGASLSAVAAQSSAAPVTAVSPRPAMPTEACEKTADGFGAFFETIVTDPALREAYSGRNVAELDLRNPGGPVRRQAEPFRIALIDSRWAYDEPEKDASELARIKLELNADGERMRADFIKAEFSADDEVIKTLGAPEAYVFEYTQQCWQLIQHLR